MPTEVLTATSGQVKAETKSKEEAQDFVYLRIRDLVYQTCGIYHSEEKLYLLSSACKRRMPQLPGSPANAREYLDFLTSPIRRESEIRELLYEITIGETCLFRSQAQLNAVGNVILPELVTERSKIGLKKT